MGEYNVEAAKRCILDSLMLIDTYRKNSSNVIIRETNSNIKESNIRDSFCSWLRLIFPDNPWWIEDHIKRSEANSAFSIAGKKRRGFVDNLVGLTAIEYETDLENRDKYNEGFAQVANYCASLLNDGHDKDLVIGVLSDTLNWYAYKIIFVDENIPIGQLGGEHLKLKEIEKIKLDKVDDLNANKLVNFLESYLGRRGSRQLNAWTISTDLGLNSPFCHKHIISFQRLVESSFNNNHKYSGMIENLWSNFIAFLKDKNTINTFDRTTYSNELYILTLAKLICANVIEKKSKLSDENEIKTILNGDYFRARGLQNLVEYDYFGWLNSSPYVENIVPIAQEIQQDLEAYDFSYLANEDIFGKLLAQLAINTKRILLGQECTPSWLASKVVSEVYNKISENEVPQLIDMCCGSGAMIVEALKCAQRHYLSTNDDDFEQRINLLLTTITGFDIDPLAVMLSKINWILAAIDWLGDLDGTYKISIPVYHADALFAATPLSSSIKDEEGQAYYKLHIAEKTVMLPSFLVSPTAQAFFDSLVDSAYSMAMYTAKQSRCELSEETLKSMVNNLILRTGNIIDDEEEEKTLEFIEKLIIAIDELQRDGRNGIWAFILRNSYRPGLVAGQFNGLVSNPPWLALSKIADNPYKKYLQKAAESFGIKPQGPSHPHIELATVFLLHSIECYLKENAIIGCILPETILNGHHHNHFRLEQYKNANINVDFEIKQLWRVDKGTFKNEAIVVFGEKTEDTNIKDEFPGKVVREKSDIDIQFKVVRHGNRVAWTDNPMRVSETLSIFEPASFREGADIMPRTLFCHEMVRRNGIRGEVLWNIKPIDIVTSNYAFLINDAKKLKDFKITPRTITNKYVFDLLTSKILSPFNIEVPSKIILPIKKDSSNRWCAATEMEIIAQGEEKQVFDEITNALGADTTINSLFNSLDSIRHKLTQQSIPNSGFIVFTPAGGKFVCSAYKALDNYNLDKLIIDQTLYWAVVNSEDEAIYLTGLFNSEAIGTIIKDFQPKGAFGERHIHSLAHGVTPPYDAEQVAHQEVVEATRNLINEIEHLKLTDIEFINSLNPNVTLQVRRRKMRTKISQLPSYQQYEDACKNLYGI